MDQHKPKPEKIALYPGTFDPVTLGHLDLIERACRHFDRVIVAVAANAEKNPLFPVKQRETLLKENLHRWPNVETAVFDCLLVDFAKQKGAQVLIRGLRAVSDFEYEIQMAQMNRNLCPEVETFFLMPNEAYTFVSSSIVRQAAAYGGNIQKFVPQNVWEALEARRS